MRSYYEVLSGINCRHGDPSECHKTFLYIALMCTGKKFTKHGKFKHSAYMYFDRLKKNIQKIELKKLTLLIENSFTKCSLTYKSFINYMQLSLGDRLSTNFHPEEL